MPLCRTAAVVILLGAGLNPSSVRSTTITTIWDPSDVGILNQFGTTTDVADNFATCCPFAGLNGVAESFAETPLPGQPPLNADIFAAARATATVGEFSVGARTFNQTDTRDISALAAATTNYFIPALGAGPVAPVVPMLMSIEGSFPMSDPAGSFVAIEILVNDIQGLFVAFTHDSNSSFTQVSRPGMPTTNLGAWTGSGAFSFVLPADLFEDTFGTLALQLWMFSNSRGQQGSDGNSADFLSTATLTAEPPPGGFVGLATGLAFVSDTAVAVPTPGSLALFVAGLAGLAALAPRRTDRP